LEYAPFLYVFRVSVWARIDGNYGEYTNVRDTLGDVEATPLIWEGAQRTCEPTTFGPRHSW